VFVDDGILWTQEDGAPAAERIVPVDLEALLFKIENPKQEQFIRFQQDPDGLRTPGKWAMLGKWFHIYAALRFGYPKTYAVSYLAPGQTEPRRAEIGSIERKVLLNDQRQGHRATPSADPHLSFEILKDRSAAVLTIGYFNYYQDEDLKRFKTFIDGGCFSSTGHLCALLKQNRIGVMVGAETGGTFECNDASHLVNLWNTPLKLYVARQTFSAAVQGMTKTTGIKPDVPIQPRIEDIIAGRDTIKECALALIDKSKGEGDIR